MSSTVLLVAVAVLLCAGPVAAQPPQGARLYRIGFVVSGSPNQPAHEAFRKGLRDAGLVEGTHVVIEARFAEGRQERLPDLIGEVIREQVDVLVVGSTSTALAAKKATTTIPIVFASVMDPVGTGIVTNLARPGGNITGAAVGVGQGFAGKWMELLKEAVPSVSHLAVLWNSANRASAQSVRDLQAAAQALTVELDVFDAPTDPALDRVLAAIGASRAQGLVVAGDPFFTVNRSKLVAFAASRRLPAVYFFKIFVEAGGLMSYGATQEESYQRAAAYVDKILKGANPGDLPVEQPTSFELAINLRTAMALGVKIPQALLLRADHVIH